MLRFKACKATELVPGAMSRFEPPDRSGIVVYNLNGDLFASDDACTHKWASLAAGDIQGKHIVCPWHGDAYNIATGLATALPCVSALRTYPVMVEVGEVVVLIE